MYECLKAFKLIINLKASSQRSDSRSPVKKSKRRSKSRSRSRQPKKAEEKLGPALPEWGSIGVIQELKPAGIGFIRPHSGKVDDKDLFFHKSALKNGASVNLNFFYLQAMNTSVRSIN